MARDRKKEREREKERWIVKERKDVYMGWLLLVGSFKLYVSFAEYSLFYRTLLQKRPVI